MTERWNEIDPKYLKKMEPVKDQMMKSKWLATIDCNAPVKYDFKPFELTQEQFDAAQAFFDLYELRSHARRMPLVLGKYLKGFERGGAKPAVKEETEALEINLQPGGGIEKLIEWIGDREFSIFFDSAPAEEVLSGSELAGVASEVFGGKELSSKSTRRKDSPTAKSTAAVK